MKSNAYYLALQGQLFQKPNFTIQIFLRFDIPKKIVLLFIKEANFRQASDYDYNVFYTVFFFGFRRKETKKIKNLFFKKFPSTQIDTYARMSKQSAICFVKISFFHLAIDSFF